MTKNTVFRYESAGRSIRFAIDSPFWITSVTGLSENDIVLSETQGVGQVGSSLTSQSVQPRDITINGIIFSQIADNRIAAISVFVPGSSGRLTVTESGKSWYVDCAPTKTPIFKNGSTMQEFQIVLHCPYPYWRSVETQPSQIAGLTSLFAFPCSLAGDWYISKYSSSLFATVTNSGSISTPFTVTFTAMSTVTNPELYHVERRAFIKINKVLEAGERFIVCTQYGSRGATLVAANGVESNGFRYLDIGSDLELQLDPGANTLRCDADNNREGLLVQLMAPKGVQAGI